MDRVAKRKKDKKSSKDKSFVFAMAERSLMQVSSEESEGDSSRSGVWEAVVETLEMHRPEIPLDMDGWTDDGNAMNELG